MKTHYARRAKKYGTQNRLNNHLESAVLLAIPEDELVTVNEELYQDVVRQCRADDEPAPSRQGLAAVMEDLARREFLVELHGTRIERLVESI